VSLFASNPSFQPSEVIQFIDNRDSGAGTLVVETDAGIGYLKALGNPDGPHALVKEFLGTHLAATLGLPTFDYALIEISDLDELPFFRSGVAEPGPAFITRAEKGQTWGEDKRMLEKIDNPRAISGLVVADTWLRNSDRYYPPSKRVNLDNVFFSSESSTTLVSLRVMDFSHCIQYGGELTERVLRSIDNIKDDNIYGLFPEFRSRISRQSIQEFAGKLEGLPHSEFEDAVALLPKKWYLDHSLRLALIDFLRRRAAHVSEHIELQLFGPTQLELDLPEGGEL